MENDSLEILARQLVARRRGFVPKRMFGGVGFIHDGNFCFGVRQETLILRLGIEEAEATLREPNTFPFAPTGRVMRGWVYLPPEGWDGRLKELIERAITFVKTLPPKVATE